MLNYYKIGAMFLIVAVLFFISGMYYQRHRDGKPISTSKIGSIVLITIWVVLQLYKAFADGDIKISYAFDIMALGAATAILKEDLTKFIGINKK